MTENKQEGPIIKTVSTQEILDRFQIKSLNLNLYDIAFENGNISFLETIVICTLIKKLAPKIIMEFGTFNGVTTLNMAANIVSTQSQRIFTVDLPPENPRTALPIQVGIEDERGYIGRSEKRFNNSIYGSSIQQIWSDTAMIDTKHFGNKVDFLFVDASHSYENCLNDSYTANEIMKKGSGICLWHDYGVPRKSGWSGVCKGLNQYYREFNLQESMFHIVNTSICIRFF